MNASPEEKMAKIIAYVHSERKRTRIAACDRTIKREGSGFARGQNGDIENLIDIQLLTTEEGYGSWGELSNIEVLNQVYDIVEKRLAWQQAQ